MSPTKQAKSQWLRKAKKGNSVALVLPKAKKTMGEPGLSQNHRLQKTVYDYDYTMMALDGDVTPGSSALLF